MAMSVAQPKDKRNHNPAGKKADGKTSNQIQTGEASRYGHKAFPFPQG
jgi:hypothetical protein